MKLKELRQKANMSQQKMAEFLNMSQTGYGQYETGRIQPDIETLIKLADFYHTTIDDLVEHEVPYLINKSQFTSEQLDLIELIKTFSREQCLLLDAYARGLIKGQQERQENFKINKM